MGSGFEAQLALGRLATLEFGGKLIHLPAPVAPGEGRGYVGGSWKNTLGLDGGDSAAPKRAVLKDIWGKNVLQLPLPHLYRVDPELSPLPTGVESLAQGLKIKRTSTSESGVTVTFDDGTDFQCQGVLFADGSDSQGKLFWDKPTRLSEPVEGVRCWTFTCANLAGLEEWQFRWATAKSVEVYPWGEGLRVHLRFNSPFGGKLTVAELRELFSEFGSDMAALFENLADSDILLSEEGPVAAVYRPARGCISLGRAAWNRPPLMLFDWLGRATWVQLEILLEQIRTGSLNAESFEAQCRERLRPLMQAEQFARTHLHSDRVLLKPFRDLLLKLLPNSFWAPRIQQKLALGEH